MSFKKSEALVEFSLVITKASQDPVTGEMRWSAVTSDTSKDSYKEAMSLALYRDFILRAKVGEKPPPEYCSEYWCGGMPYPSIAHYKDMNGNAVPGKTTHLYIDGDRLKAKGIFFDSQLGRAAFKSVRESTKSEAQDNKVRISIGFLDYKHAHGQAVFERKSIHDICPMCLGGAGEKVYLAGMLIHLALTRVPVNKRTIIEAEVDKAMADDIKTRKDDAASIVGEELAEELEQRAQAGVERSESLVIKAEDEPVVVEAAPEPEPVAAVVEESVPAEAEKMAMGDPGATMPFGGATAWDDYDAWNTQQQESARIYDAWYTMEAMAGNILMSGAPDMPTKMTALLKGCHKRMEMKSLITLSRLDEILAKPETPHILDSSITELKSAFDRAQGNSQEKLIAVQPAFNALGEVIRSSVEQADTPPAPEQPAQAPEMRQVISDEIRSLIAPLTESVQMLQQQFAAQKSAQEVQAATPPRRALTSNPANVAAVQRATVVKPPAPDNPTPKLREQIRKSVYINQ